LDIEAQINGRERTEKSSQELTFLSEAAIQFIQFMHFKEAWRNHAMQGGRRLMNDRHGASLITFVSL
jgi:hypothetical protein